MEIRSSAPANPVQLYSIDSSIPEDTDIINVKKSAKIQHLDILLIHLCLLTFL